MSPPPYPCLNVAPNDECSATPTYPGRECTSGCSFWGQWFTGKPWPQGWGNADNWPAAARAAGFVLSALPAPGSIMCIPPNVNGAGPEGHVAFVTGEPEAGLVPVIEVNWKPEYAADTRPAPVGGCEFILLTAAPIPQPPTYEDDMIYLFETGEPGIWCLYFGKYFHVTPDDIAAFQAFSGKPIQTIGAEGHTILLATYPAQ